MNFLHDSGLLYIWKKLKTIFILKKDLVNSVYPIGSIYISFKNVPPNNFIGGVWERWAEGRIIVGVDETTLISNSAWEEWNNDPEALPEDEPPMNLPGLFGESNITGGEKKHTLTTEEIPSHNHGTISLTGGAYNYAAEAKSTPIWGGGVCSQRVNTEWMGWCGSSDYENNKWDGFQVSADHTHDTQGANVAHNNLQPYRTCYIWRRVN